MYFYDLSNNQYPREAQYYFNVLLVDVSVCPELWKEKESSIWDITRVNEPRPVAFHIYVDNDMESDEEWAIDCYPHTVIEVANEISWYYMLDSSDSNDVWEIG